MLTRQSQLRSTTVQGRLSLSQLKAWIKHTLPVCRRAYSKGKCKLWHLRVHQLGRGRNKTPGPTMAGCSKETLHGAATSSTHTWCNPAKVCGRQVAVQSICSLAVCLLIKKADQSPIPTRECYSVKCRLKMMSVGFAAERRCKW